MSGDAPPEYADAERFFSRTLITDGLTRFTGEVLRRLSGEREAANAVLNLVTEFGGGKTHALTLLYHLARLGAPARDLPGVRGLLQAARLDEVPTAAVAVFVGTEWDAIAGKGGNGEQHRRTPWGDLAWQFAEQAGDPSLFEAVSEQDEARVGPGKDAIRRFLPSDRPVLILMDEVMNFMTRARGIRVEDSTLASQFYEFVHNLTDEADARDRLAVVVSLPKSEEEMSAEDWGDFKRLSKVTTRVAEPYTLAKELEIPEIVRRRLFDEVGSEADVRETARAYDRWLDDHRDLIPGWFPVDRAEEILRATYPFHPTVLSVFQRKWQSLSSFQRTRGILRLLAQWVSIAYAEGYQGAHRDALVGMGTAPLEDQFFREAVLQQLGSDELKAAVISDIAGEEAFAERMDAEAPETLRAGRVHRKVATAIFFESSGGQVRERATLPEIRLAVGEPRLDVGNIETAIEALRDSCYYLAVEGGEYRFSAKPNLNRLLADRRAALDPADVEEHARAEVRRVLGERRGVEKPFDLVFFPDDPSLIGDVPALRLVVVPPERARGDETRSFIERSMREHGASPRRFTNALVWLIPDSAGLLLDATRRHRAWESLETDRRDLDDDQRAQLGEQKARAKLDLKEAVWRTYRWLAFLGSEGELREEDLGLVHSSAAESMQALIQARLRQHDELTETLAPARLVRNWPGGRTEWSSKEARDAVYASPAFTRLLDSEALRATIARGVADGQFGYGVKGEAGYVRVIFEDSLDVTQVEFSDDAVLLLPDTARAIREAEPSPETPVPTGEPTPKPQPTGPTGQQGQIFTGEKVAGATWEGSIPPQRWTQFYTRVLSRLVGEGNLELKVRFDSRPRDGLLKERVDGIRESLEELGLVPDLIVEELGEND